MFRAMPDWFSRLDSVNPRCSLSGDDIFIAVEGCGGARFDQLLISSRTAVYAAQRIPTAVRMSFEISALVWTRNRFDLQMRAHRGDNYVECH